MSDDQTAADQSEVVATAAAVSDGAYTLFVADFAEASTAWQAYEALKSVEDGRSLEIEGVIVVKRDTDGELEIQKATDHSTRHGLKWGLVGGVALGLIFPPSILGSAAVAGGLGARWARPDSSITAVSWPASSSSPLHRDTPASWLWSRTRSRGDPQGASSGRCHRGVRGGRRTGQGHQGGRQGGRVRELIMVESPRWEQRIGCSMSGAGCSVGRAGPFVSRSHGPSSGLTLARTPSRLVPHVPGARLSAAYRTHSHGR